MRPTYKKLASPTSFRRGQKESGLQAVLCEAVAAPELYKTIIGRSLDIWLPDQQAMSCQEGQCS